MEFPSPQFRFQMRGFFPSLAFFCALQFLGIGSFAQNAQDELKPPQISQASPEASKWFGRSFDRTSLTIMASGVVGSLVMQPHDENINQQWVNHQRMSEDKARIGDLIGSGAPGLLIGLGQLYFDKPNGEAMLKSWVAVSLWTGALKTLVGRQRPGGSENRQSWPSGHTSVSFATATALGMAYGWKVGVPAGLLAVGVGASRLADNRHWMSDVVGGAAVGIWMGYAYAVPRDRDTFTDISPVSGPNREGVSVTSTRPFLLYPSFENETVFLRLVSEY